MVLIQYQHGGMLLRSVHPPCEAAVAPEISAYGTTDFHTLVTIAVLNQRGEVSGRLHLAGKLLILLFIEAMHT